MSGGWISSSLLSSDSRRVSGSFAAALAASSRAAFHGGRNGICTFDGTASLMVCLLEEAKS
eukprot:1056238-Pyramimonas_sp.AAC.1